jgi:hypothetical protein
MFYSIFLTFPLAHRTAADAICCKLQDEKKAMYKHLSLSGSEYLWEYCSKEKTILVIGVVQVLINKARYLLFQILHKPSTIYIGTSYKIPHPGPSSVAVVAISPWPTWQLSNSC